MEDMSREDFERNFFLLKEKEVKFAKGLTQGIESLSRVRYLPNKRIDFLTVDELARLNANMMMSIDEEFIKKVQEEIKE